VISSCGRLAVRLEGEDASIEGKCKGQHGPHADFSTGSSVCKPLTPAQVEMFRRQQASSFPIAHTYVFRFFEYLIYELGLILAAIRVT
jgi:hypothetical protein